GLVVLRGRRRSGLVRCDDRQLGLLEGDRHGLLPSSRLRHGCMPSAILALDSGGPTKCPFRRAPARKVLCGCATGCRRGFWGARCCATPGYEHRPDFAGEECWLRRVRPTVLSRETNIPLPRNQLFGCGQP